MSVHTQGIAHTIMLNTHHQHYYSHLVQQRRSYLLSLSIMWHLRYLFLTFSLSQRSLHLLRKELQIYFMCESQGHNPDNPCDRSQFERFTYPTVFILSLSFVLLAPVVNFLFLVNFQLLLTIIKSIVQAQFTSVFSKNSIS